MSIHVLLTNRTATLLQPYNPAKLLPYWSFSAPAYHWALKNNPNLGRCKVCHRFRNNHNDKGHEYAPVWDGKIRLLKRDRISAGLFHGTRLDLEKKGIKFKVKHMPRTLPAFSSDKWINSEGKYDFQNICVDRMQASVVNGGGLILNATGSGKTRIAAMFASRFNVRILFIVDQLNLLEQARHDIGKHLGEKIGKVGESEFKLRRVTAATRQTLSLHIDDPKFHQWYEGVDVLFIDEIHDQMSKSNFKVVEKANPFCVFGLTATLALKQKPIRLRAYSLCGPVLYEYPVTKGMKEGVLSKGIVIQFLYNNSERETNAYTSEELYKKKVVKNGERNFLVKEIARRAERRNRFTIILVERLKHLSRISYQLGDTPHRIIAGTFRGKHIRREDRVRHQEKFEKGKVRIIVANKVMKKGVDIKRVDVIVDAAARKSKNDAVQKFGRGVRLHPDKDGLLYIDIADTDKYDKFRRKHEKKNSLAKAAKSRRRAFIQAGITVKQFVYDEDKDEKSQIKEMFKKAEVWLRREVDKHEIHTKDR